LPIDERIKNMTGQFRPFISSWTIFDEGAGEIATLLPRDTRFSIRAEPNDRISFDIPQNPGSSLNSLALEYLDNAQIHGRLGRSKALLPHYDSSRTDDYPGALVSVSRSPVAGHVICVTVEDARTTGDIVTVSLVEDPSDPRPGTKSDGSAHGNNY
jgi:hypothetical protein